MALFTWGCAVSRSPERLATPVQVAQPNAGDASNALAPAFPARAALDESLVVRSSERVAALKSKGGECATYGSVLETTLLAGRVSVRDYMWRVDGKLVSGEARTDGAIVVARHIDPLNIGVRTVDDILWTLEHEAAHVAFRISNGRDAIDDQANEVVRSCR